MKHTFNGLGQLVTEHQAHGGAVGGGTPKVQYVYSEMAGGANHSRLVSLIYPNGRVLDFNYDGTLNYAISRLSSISEWTEGEIENLLDPEPILVTLETYAYLGLSTVIHRGRPQPDINLTFIGATGDAGDQYAGLDRFGRVVDQRWNDGEGTAVDRYRYGYDPNGNRLYRENLLASTLSELYHANGESNGYDKLNQLSDFRRGTLSDCPIRGQAASR